MQEAFESIPPFTRIYGIIVIGLGLIVSLKLIHPIYLVYSFDLVFGRGEIWRLFTSIFFIGQLDFNFLLYIITSFMFIAGLERSHFSERTSNLVFIFILNSIFSLLLSTLFTSFSVGSSVLHSLEFIYAKLFPDQMVNLFMIIPVRVAYLPFVHLLLAVLQGGSMIPALIGIISGHLTFYLLFILPVEINRPILKCPECLVDWIDRRGLANGGNPRPQDPLRGRGRRIGN